MSLDILFLNWNRQEFAQLSLDLLRKHTDWSLVRRLVVMDDISEEDTLTWLREELETWPVPTVLSVKRRRSPVRAMQDYLDDDPGTTFVKIDNDVAVPPNWLRDLKEVWDVRELAGLPIDALGAEAGMTVFEQSAVDHDFEPSTHIGGVGMLRTAWFKKKPRLRPNGHFGWTEHQHRYKPVRGWITPDLLMPCLDRIPEEPFSTLSRRYVAAGWQRRYGLYDPVWGRRWWEWLLDEPGFAVLEQAVRDSRERWGETPEQVLEDA